MSAMWTDTIAAVSTSLLSNAAIAIVRLSGPDAFAVLRKIFRSRETEYEGYRIYFGTIVDPENGETVDQVLVNIFRAPHSYTGEDMAEINCHGGMVVTRRVLTLCLAQGARQALPGEFTRRAYLNGKMDLTQAEAVNDLVSAETLDGARLAASGLTGSVKKLLDPLLDEVMQIIAHIEVNIDYPEYDDIGTITAGQISPLVDDWLARGEKILELSQSSLILKEGVKTVILGKPNVGKSSLLNALLARQKAIVNAQAGTTRDLVEGEIRLGHVTLHLTDTAGIHDTDNEIEQMGIERSREALAEAQLVLLVVDGSQPLDEEDEKLIALTADKPRLIVYNKQDLTEEQRPLGISAKNGDIAALTQAIEEMFAQHRIALDQPGLTNERQIALMRQAQAAMRRVKEQLAAQVPLDLVNEDLQEAYRCLKEILGEYSREDLLDGIFSRFCVGK